VLSTCPLPSWAKDKLYNAQLPGLANLSLTDVLERTRHLLTANIKGCGPVITMVCCSTYATRVQETADKSYTDGSSAMVAFLHGI